MTLRPPLQLRPEGIPSAKLDRPLIDVLMVILIPFVTIAGAIAGAAVLLTLTH